MSYALYQLYNVEIGLIPLLILYMLSFLVVVLATTISSTWHMVIMTLITADTWLYFGFIEHMRMVLVRLGILRKQNAKRA